MKLIPIRSISSARHGISIILHMPCWNQPTKCKSILSKAACD